MFEIGRGNIKSVDHIPDRFRAALDRTVAILDRATMEQLESVESVYAYTSDAACSVCLTINNGEQTLKRTGVAAAASLVALRSDVEAIFAVFPVYTALHASEEQLEQIERIVDRLKEAGVDNLDDAKREITDMLSNDHSAGDLGIEPALLAMYFERDGETYIASMSVTSNEEQQLVLSEEWELGTVSKDDSLRLPIPNPFQRNADFARLVK